MKITITQEFDSPEEAVSFLGEVGEIAVRASERPDPVPTPATDKKPRKPRSDAGQPRGPYKKDEAPVPTPEPAAPAPVVQPGPTPGPAPEAAVPAAPTLVEVKAAMTVLGKAKGIQANIDQLKLFGVQKVSDLPADKYPAFIAAVLAKAAS